jgi:hypothetical protein
LIAQVVHFGGNVGFHFNDVHAWKAK